MTYLTLEKCIAYRSCWPVSKLEEYGKQYDGKVPMAAILNDPDMSAVDKMWCVIEAGVLSDKQMHSLAIDYAKHYLTDENVCGKKALRAKEAWLEYYANKFDVHQAANSAWEEAKTLKRSRAAAFACSLDPKIAVLGTASIAGGWYGEDVDTNEKLYQWTLMKAEVPREELTLG